ncbi:hypothetical protein DL764_009178 [Monosporascus ibericus]|uniref:Major facilitator superfamily (MFS) profile domain-containing protein n=1 Tax=Monosporascus ibericus TaxID=155417 RepID=A0A4Q4SVP9_9PEZI|nr:hypothetical protein DL764_009178 [Monosporascus ibericus]
MTEAPDARKMDLMQQKHNQNDLKVDQEEIEQKKDITAALKLKDAVDEEQIMLFRQFMVADEGWHENMTKKLLRKVDLHLLPMLVMMYLLNFLDRNNLSQARLGGLEADLNMTGTDFNLATSILFVGYLLMQLPSNLMLTRLPPAIYLGAAMSICGFAEAPFFPGAVFLMSSWYRRSELTQRMSWFYAGSSLANAFGGLIGAGVLGNLHGTHGISGWRWLFIIEGTITIGVAIASAFILPNYPATTRWLTPEERAYAQWRLVDDAGEADSAGASSIKEGLIMALKDPRLYLFTLLQHSSLLSQTFQYFFPTIVQTLGFGTVETLLITAPVWIGTFLVSVLVTYTSGRFDDRGFHIIGLMLVSVIGNIIVVSTLNTGARFFAMFLMPMGAVSAYTIILSWVANSFHRPLVKRSACISITNMIGNCANIYGSYMYPASHGPRYLPGGCSTAGVALFVAFLAVVVRIVLTRQNKKLAEREIFEARGEATNSNTDGGEARATGFRYIL